MKILWSAFSVDLICKIKTGCSMFQLVLPASAWVLGLLQLPPTVPNTCIWDKLADLNCPQVLCVGPAMSL